VILITEGEMVEACRTNGSVELYIPIFILKTLRKEAIWSRTTK